MIEVIKYSGDDKTFVFSHLLEELNPESQLIVDESQEAILYCDGQMKALFAPGNYKLGSIVNSLPDTKTLINAVIYIVDKMKQIDMRWGVGNVDFTEPEFGVLLNIGAHGNLILSISDAKLFFDTCISADKVLTHDKFFEAIKEFLLVRVKVILAEIVNSHTRFDVFTIRNELDILTDLLQKKLTEDFINYGLQLIDLDILKVHINENQPNYELFRKLKKPRENIPIDPIFPICIHPPFPTCVHPTFPDDMPIIQVIKKIAGNEGVSGFASAGLGIGLGLGAGIAAGTVLSGMYGDVLNTISVTDSPSTPEDIQPKSQRDKWLDLKELWDLELITEEEYNARKIEILSEI